jgi:amino acid transporter
VAVSAASIARGSAAYAQIFVPLPDWMLAGLIVIVFTVIACFDVRESVGLAAGITVLEVAGLLFVSGSGLAIVEPSWDSLARFVPQDGARLLGLVGGAFVAFFAFLGFETVVNMAEEVVDARRTVPRAILASVAISAALYVMVAVITVLVVRPGSEGAPLLVVLERHGEAVLRGFSVIAMLSVANGVLVHLVMLARLLYGMARHGWMATALGTVNPRTRTPVRASLLAGGVVLVLAVAFAFERLLAVATLVTLVIFILVALALWRLHQLGPGPAGTFTAPRWVPPLAALGALGLIVSQLFV